MRDPLQRVSANAQATMNLRLASVLFLAVALLAAGPAAAQRQVSDAIQQLQAELERSPDDGALLGQLAEAHYLKGSDASKAGRCDDAIQSFKQGLTALQSKAGAVPANAPVAEELRYGIAYCDLMLGNAQDAVVVLDLLVSQAPTMGKARYLLGVALMRTGTPADTRRGLQVFMQTAAENMGPEREMAIHAAYRYAYNVGTEQAALGHAGQALQTLRMLREQVGFPGGATPREDGVLRYGMGYFAKASGQVTAGLAEWQALLEKDAQFKLRNGLTLREVLGTTYYQAGCEALTQGSPGSLELALSLLDNAARYGDPNAPDMLYAKAVAYKQLGQTSQLQTTLDALRKADPGYFGKVNTGS